MNLLTIGLAAAAIIALFVYIARTQTITQARKTMKEGGIKKLFKVYGWKAAAAIFVYYLVRDVTLYIVIPWLVARGVMST